MTFYPGCHGFTGPGDSWQTPTTQGSDEIETAFEEMIDTYISLCVQLHRCIDYISPIWTDLCIQFVDA